MIKEATIQQILELSGGDSSILVELFESFNNDAAELQEEIVAAFDKHDYKALKSSIHTLKGLSGTIGATSLFELCYNIDLELKNSGAFTDENALQQLVEENEKLKIYIIDKYLK